MFRIFHVVQSCLNFVFSFVWTMNLCLLLVSVTRDREHVGQEGGAIRRCGNRPCWVDGLLNWKGSLCSKTFTHVKIQWAFRSMEGEAMLWFQCWCQEDFFRICLRRWRRNQNIVLRGEREMPLNSGKNDWATRNWSVVVTRPILGP